MHSDDLFTEERLGICGGYTRRAWVELLEAE